MVGASSSIAAAVTALRLGSGTPDVAAAGGASSASGAQLLSTPRAGAPPDSPASSTVSTGLSAGTRGGAAPDTSDSSSLATGTAPGVVHFVPTAGKINSEERKRQIYQAAFNKYDLDASGSIDPDEFKLMLADLRWNLSEAEVAAAINELDKSKNGRIELDEFLKWSQFAWDHIVTRSRIETASVRSGSPQARPRGRSRSRSPSGDRVPLTPTGAAAGGVLGGASTPTAVDRALSAGSALGGSSGLGFDLGASGPSLLSAGSSGSAGAAAAVSGAALALAASSHTILHQPPAPVCEEDADAADADS